jgi:hypothetical protein
MKTVAYASLAGLESQVRNRRTDVPFKKLLVDEAT